MAFISLRTTKKRFRSEINAIFFRYFRIHAIMVRFPNLEEIPWHSCQLLDTVIVSP